MTGAPDEIKRGAFPRAWRILEFLTGYAKAATAQEVSQVVGLPLPTTMRLLNTLIGEELVEFDKDHRVYWPGPAMFRLIALGTQSGLLGSLSRIPLRELAQATGETACLNLLQPKDRFSVVAVEEGQHALRYVVELGGLHPLDRGAGAKAILAFLPEARQQAIIDIQSEPEAMEEELAGIRERGLTISFGERVPGAVGVAMPVYGLGGEIRGSVQVTLPEHRFDQSLEERLREPLTRAANALSAAQLLEGHEQ